MVYQFKELDLKRGDYIDIMTATGEVFDGIYEGAYDNSRETFEFRNYCSGKTETIEIEKLQRIQKR